jgi:hypothetical protein
MPAIIFQGATCPDGVEFWQAPESDPPDALLRKLRYRTDRRIPVLLEVTNLEEPISLKFVNANSEPALLSFFARWGLLLPTESLTVKDALEAQRTVKEILVAAGGGSMVDAINIINEECPTLVASIRLSGPDGKPRAVLEAPTIWDVILMECIMIAENGVRYAECAHCGTPFLTGPLTWRRSHARFCSDRCRVAAMRVRNAKEVKRGQHPKT